MKIFYLSFGGRNFTTTRKIALGGQQHLINYPPNQALTLQWSKKADSGPRPSLAPRPLHPEILMNRRGTRHPIGSAAKFWSSENSLMKDLTLFSTRSKRNGYARAYGVKPLP